MERTYNLEVALITDLVPWAKNPRIHPPEQIERLCASMKEFGFTAPITIDEEGKVLAGNGRLSAALALGHTGHIPALRVSGLTDAQKSALVVVDNKIGETAVWDEQLLELTIDSLLDTDLELGELGDETAAFFL